MATIKSYTDIEQSRKLAEILPLQGADMAWCNNSLKGVNYVDNFSANLYTVKEMQNVFDNALHGWDKYWELIPCWSLAALLDVLPYTIYLSRDTIDANGNPAYKNECYKFSINRCGLFGDKWNIQYYGKHQRQLGERYKELYIQRYKDIYIQI